MFRNRKVKCYIMIAALMVMLFSLALPAAARPLEVEADRLNVRSGPGTGNKVLSLVTRGTVLKPVQEKDDWVQVILPSGERGWVAGWYTAPYSPQRYATVNVTGLNVRSGPGTAYRVIDLLADNTSVPVLREENDWFNVLLPDGKHGWLAGWHTATAQFKGYVMVKGSLNFRSGPGTGHKIRGKLAKGDLLAVIGVSSSGNWLRVVAENGSTGWVSKSYTKPLDGKDPVDKPASALSGKTVVLDPGQASRSGSSQLPGIVKIVNLAVARELAALLGQAGSAIMTRTGDLNPTLWQRLTWPTPATHQFL